jgi:hypothetical protein
VKHTEHPPEEHHDKVVEHADPVKHTEDSKDLQHTLEVHPDKTKADQKHD